MNISKTLKHSLLAVSIGLSPLGGLEQTSAQPQNNEATETEELDQPEEQVKHDHSDGFYTKTYTQKNLPELLQELQKHPTGQGYVRLSDLYIKEKQWTNGAEAARKAIQINPKDWQGYFDLSTVLVETGDYDGAWRQLERCQKLSPHRPEIYVNFSEIQIRRRKFYSAILYLEMALKINPDYHNVRFRLQEVKEHLQNYK